MNVATHVVAASPRDAAVARIHRHCAVYTGPEAVEALLDLVGWTSSTITAESRLLEPACGDGSFLLPAIDRLLDWHAVEAHADLEPMIRAYEFDADTACGVRDSARVLLERRGVPAERATALVQAWIHAEDFLLSDADRAFTHVVGNPPYMRWSLVPAPLRAAYEAALPKSAARGDLCLAFWWKAAELVSKPGSRIAFLCADRWLRCAYGGEVRDALARTHALSTHLEVHGVPVFKGSRKVGAYAALSVLERGGEGRTRFGRASSLEQMGVLARSTQDDAGSLWPAGRGSSARLAPIDLRDLLDVIAPVTRDLANAGVHVRCGTALGHAKAFVIAPDAAIEDDRKRPYLRSRDLREDGSVAAERSVIDVWSREGTLVDLHDYPCLARHLANFREDLEGRACVAGRPHWYRTIDKIDRARTSRPKVVVAGMARRARVAYDPGGHVAANAIYCLESAEWPTAALASVFRAGLLDLFGEVLSPRFAGGTRRFDGNVLRQVRIPGWESVEPSLRRRIDARQLADGIDPALVADLLKLGPPHRRTLERLLAEADATLTGDAG